MRLYRVRNQAKVSELAKQLNMPAWLVQSLIVEYLPCRQFLEQDTWILFDFGGITVKDIESLMYPRVCLNGITIFHNILPNVLRTRILHGMVGRPMAMVGEGYEFIPEGRVSPNYVPYAHNPIDVFDWKLALNGFAVVEDETGLFQWPTCLYAPDSESTLTGGQKSDIYDMDQMAALYRIETQVIAALSLSFPDKGEEREAAVKLLQNLYHDLERIRTRMRESLVAYHESVKSSSSATAGYSEDVPPILTTFDQIRIRDGMIDVRTHIEPLFFRAASRALQKADKAKLQMEAGEVSPTNMEEELEASAECITLSVMCLEAYINGVLQDRLAKYDDALEQMDLGAKWLMVPGLLGKSDCFSKGTQPYQDFAILIGWRNKLAHYKHRFQQPKEVKGVGRVSSIYAICNANNARTSVETIRRMIRTLCECLGQPSPRWIDAEESWLYGQKDESQEK